MISKEPGCRRKERTEIEKYKIVAVGGTFDELHKGHKILLVKAFEAGERVLIGLSSDQFANKMNKPHHTAPYEQRLSELKTFLSQNKLSKRMEIIPLNDPYGVTLRRGSVEAIVVSRETEPMALNINRKRKEAGLPPIRVIVIDMVPSDNHAAISTTRIHRGEIDREGHLLKRQSCARETV